ncbi:hypothetical protein A7X12_21710 [Sphingomonas sp. TDK1]|nr:hypothetical protein A7X12_21710 [Sphingomonas sp. TDK1]
MSGEMLGALAPLVGYHLRRALSAFTADFTAAMDGTGLRQVPLAVLAIVQANPGINQGAAGRMLGIKRANMVALINDLVDKQLIERVVDSSDRRAFSLTLTQAGERAMADAIARIQAHERRMLSDMTEEERGLLLDLLSRIERRSPAAEGEENGEG